MEKQRRRGGIGDNAEEIPTESRVQSAYSRLIQEYGSIKISDKDFEELSKEIAERDAHSLDFLAGGMTRTGQDANSAYTLAGIIKFGQDLHLAPDVLEAEIREFLSERKNPSLSLPLQELAKDLEGRILAIRSRIDLRGYQSSEDVPYGKEDMLRYVTKCGTDGYMEITASWHRQCSTSKNKRAWYNEETLFKMVIEDSGPRLRDEENDIGYGSRLLLCTIGLPITFGIALKLLLNDENAGDFIHDFMVYPIKRAWYRTKNFFSKQNPDVRVIRNPYAVGNETVSLNEYLGNVVGRLDSDSKRCEVIRFALQNLEKAVMADYEKANAFISECIGERSFKPT